MAETRRNGKNRSGKYLTLLDAEDFALEFDCEPAKARDIFNIPDFPAFELGKTKVVELNALLAWLAVPHRKER